MKKRIKAGDLARIYESENDQYIQKRRALALQAKMDFETSGFFLSLFYRDSQGKPMIANSLPTPKAQLNIDQLNPSKALQLSLERNLKIRQLKSEVEIDLSKATEDEASNYRWTNFTEALNETEPFKKHVYLELERFFTENVLAK